jgi:hypothetical protein
MARGHGRILTPIWEDADFLALTQEQQRLYLFLISQPNLNHAGLLPLTLRRWARKACGLTSAELEKHLTALADARFIVIDEDTEELLIRSFVRNDGVWRMPKVMGAMVSGAMEISSTALRAALLAEMDRIPLDELSDEPTKIRDREGPSIRRQVADHIETLRKAFGAPLPDPTRGGSAPPCETPSRTPSDTPDEGGREGSTRGRARASHARTPAPTPTPNPSPIGEEGGAVAAKPAANAVVAFPAPDGAPAPIDIDQFAVTDSMRRWANATYPGLDLDHSTAQFLSHYRSTGARRKSWPDAWQKWIRDDAKKASQRPPLRAVSGGHQPFRNPTDDSVWDEDLI